MKNTIVINQAREYQLQIIKDYKKDPYNLISHLSEVERWAHKLLKMYPDADKDVVLLSVWLHDIGHYTGDQEIDHAIKSEKLAREFLVDKINDELIDKVSRAVRAHRCKDVQPETIEEKIVALIDSASHMTGETYIEIIKSGRFEYCLAKAKRDFRDIGLFPKIQEGIKPIYDAWIALINEYKKLGIVEEKEIYTETS